jgi:periplasmic divalent cation tolerance protein
MQAILAYVTTRDADEARRIGQALVEERLAACVNILDGMRSMYWWEGQVQHEQEAVLMAKTRHELADSLIGRVKELHSYECPCVVMLPIDKGNPDFLKWIGEQTRGGE